MDQRAEALNREWAVEQASQVPKEIGGIPPVVAATTKQEVETQPAESVPKEEIMVPKWRFDEINSQYQKLRDQPQPQAEAAPPAPQPSVDLEKMVDSKLAPLRVQLEVDQVLRGHPDFQEFAPKVLERIKSKPSLSLEEAYQLEKYSSIESKAKEEGKAEAYEVIEKKASLQVEQSGRKTVTPSVEELIRDKTVPLSEIARMLPRE